MDSIRASFKLVVLYVLQRWQKSGIFSVLQFVTGMRGNISDDFLKRFLFDCCEKMRRCEVLSNLV